MGVMKKFFEELDWTKLRRDDSFVINAEQDPAKRPMAAMAEDRSWGVIFVPKAHAHSLNIDVEKLKSDGFVIHEVWDASSLKRLSQRTGSLFGHHGAISATDKLDDLDPAPVAMNDWIILSRKVSIKSLKTSF